MLIRRHFFIYTCSSLALCTLSHTANASHFNLCLPSQHLITSKRLNTSRQHFRYQRYLHRKYKLDAVPFEDITQEAIPPLWFDPNSPIFAEQLLAVFGKTSLSLRLQNTEKKTTKKRTLGFQKKKSKISKKEKERLWVSEVFGEISKLLPFQNGMDIGSNSNSDVYVEVNAEKNWDLFANWKLDASQTFRYASQSKNYSETDFNFTQQRSDKDLASNQFSIVKSYAEEFTWSDKLFMQKKFLDNKSITYGIYTSGIYSKEKKDVELQSWGPYFGWRIPIWRNWVFLENDVSYYRDSTATDGYSFSSNIQLEATF
ncbi:hypothetical protein P256_01898 [Acinetobacter nectaris CIP 110549]|uniref:Selenocysteine synthase n=1 Tax=Acinetobacter nectaris CIP 110549 TaxID=1392540 RepID=V2USQ8_9GAMM|nr:hypothetical protein [Acinetobacter nectaris]ESK38364.1 hypothetical protein P256_01898 [Acinetobacter nectaris CIP 110549]